MENVSDKQVVYKPNLKNMFSYNCEYLAKIIRNTSTFKT